MNGTSLFARTARQCAALTALAATVCNAATIHVSTTGSDDTGDGSQTNPYATAAFALDFLVDDRDSLEIPRKAAMAIHGHVGDSNDIPAWGRYRLQR